MSTPYPPWRRGVLCRSSNPLCIKPTQLGQEVGFLVDFAELGAPLYLHRPLRIHQAHHPDSVTDILQRAEQEAQAGHWVAGFLSYEAAAAFALPVYPPTGFPLAWFAVFSQVEPVVFPLLPAPVLQPLSLDITQQRYQQDIQTILAHIVAGDSYQVNYTVGVSLSDVDPATLFLAVQSAHRHPYAAWLHWGEGTVASFSPELFLQRNGEQLLTAPIKGTCGRFVDLQVDAEQGWVLEHSAKERAEHLMIVDMARNDLGKVCQIGTVKVDPLFERRIFPTVQHLESRVWGRQRSGLGLAQLMAAIFPAASITGAPKHRTMEIIHTLEGRPRGLYTGALGIVCPGGDFIFNVAIRTVTWQKNGKGQMGLGGGIVADSDSTREWAEIADKGRFLHTVPPNFQLLETFFLNQDGDLTFFEQHMSRLEHSARCLGFACDRSKIETAVRQTVLQWHQEGLGERVVRLLLHMSGTIRMEHRPCAVVVQPLLKVQVVAQRVDRFDRLLRHKTTRRSPFDHALSMAKAAGADEGLFLNTLGQVTEGAIRAILVRFGARWHAPPLEDGLLPSIWRAETMQQLQATEKSLTLEELLLADEVWMGNSVQGGAHVIQLSDHSGQCLAEWSPFSPPRNG